MIAANLDVPWNQVSHRCVCTAEHYVFSSSLQIVIDDLERAGTVPSRNGLCVLSHTFPIGQVGVDNGQRGAVESHAAFTTFYCVAVDEAPIKNEVVRKVTQISLIANAEPYESVNVNSICGRELYRDEAEVVSAGGCLQRRTARWTDNPRHQVARRRSDSCACRGQARVRRRRTHDNISRT